MVNNMSARTLLDSRRTFKFKNIEGLFYVAPWIIGFLWLQLFPFLMSLYYSMTDFALVREPNWVGFQNYIRLFTRDPDFWHSLRVTSIYAFIVVPGVMILSLIVAMILNMKLRAINLFRTAYYLPSILGGSIAVATLWRVMFMRAGVINQLIEPLGLGPVDWLGNPDIALFTVSMLSIWQFGSPMVIFLAALKQVPSSLYEAARVDGASKLRIFFNITLPMLTPIILFNFVMQFIIAMQEFTSAFIITSGGPARATWVLGIKLYEDAFRFFRMGYAAALSWIMFIIIAVITMLVFRSSSAWVFYEDGGDF